MVDGVREKCRVPNNLMLHRGKKIPAVRDGDNFRMVKVRV
jgi:hypothetical protein